MSEEQREEPKQHWSLDRRVPLGFLLGIAIQTAVFAFWVGGLTAQVDSNTQELRDRKNDGFRLSVMETKLDEMSKNIAELKILLRELSAEKRKP